MIIENVNNAILMPFFIPNARNQVTIRLAEAGHNKLLTLSLSAIPFKQWNWLKSNIPLCDLDQISEIESEKTLAILKSENGSPYFRKRDIELIFSIVSDSNKLVLKTKNTDLKPYLLYEPRSEFFVVLLIQEK